MTFKVPANLKHSVTLIIAPAGHSHSSPQHGPSPELPIPEPLILCLEPEQAPHPTTPL